METIQVYRFFSLLYFSLFARSVLAQVGNGDYFTRPPPKDSGNDWSANEVYHVGDILEIEWQTTMKDFSILLWQDVIGKSGALFANKSDPMAFNWSVALTIDSVTFDNTLQSDGSGPSFFFAMYNETAGKGAIAPAFRTHSFNISSDPSTTSSSTPSGPTTSLTVQTGDITPTVSPQPVASSTASSSGLTTAQQAGIGVGAGVASLIAIVALIWFCIRRRRPGAMKMPPDAGGPYDAGGGAVAGREFYKPNPYAGGGGPAKTRHSQPIMSELGGESRSAEPSELGDSSGRERQSGREPGEYFTPSTAVTR